MAEPVPVDYNPFGADQGSASAAPQQASAPVPVDYDPFSNEAKDPAKMQSGEYWKGVASNLPSSAYENIAGTAHALAPWNWKETAQGLGDVGYGLYSKAKGALGYEHNSEDEIAADALVKPFTSKDEFYRTLYNDPFSIASVAAIPLTGGASGLAKGAEMLGEASTAGRLARLGSKAAGAASYAADPTKAAMGVVSGLGDAGKGFVKQAVGAATGVDPAAYEAAFNAGAAKGPQAQAIKDSFNTFAKGQGDPVQFSQSLQNALKDIKESDQQNWASKKENMMAATQDAPLKPIYDAIDDARSQLSERKFVTGPDGNGKWQYTGVGPDQAAHEALDQIENNLYQRSLMPSGSEGRTILGLDKLKQELWELSGQQGLAGNALKNVHAGVKQAIRAVSPEYDDLMENYQAHLANIKNLNTSLGSRSAANAQMAKVAKAFTTPQGQSLINQIAEKDPRIPYMIAGSMLNGAMAEGPIARLIEGGGGAFHLYNAGTNLAAGNPAGFIKHMGILGAQSVLQSPKIMGLGAYGLGKVAGSPVGSAARGIGNATSTAARVLSPVEQNINRSQPAPPEEEIPFTQTANYARGGSVKQSAKTKAETLINMVDKIKKEQGNETKPLLNLDDTTVAKALAIANRGI